MSLIRSLVRPRPLLVLTALACWAGVGLALLSQYRFDMPPCPWCTLQRLIFLVLGAAALLGAAVEPLRKPLAGLGVLLALSGAAAALWQHFVAAASASCNLTLADRILESLGLLDLAPEVFMPMASCADAAVNLLGVPYAFWSLALFALAGLACLSALRR
ncbi:disulfide bond formation protein B [Ideonella sp. 4Y11]|uniref:Disulfide bond formation protein B n=1 Tax=Ideonella aquatica TaxID=2824119 RepID=A0A941BLF9_9BURK|nr:disulfide bond formation protein B [Ideonella aquatica]MBQ0959654.1 disulfide bond formation protein B [Ideonella aquatica]